MRVSLLEFNINGIYCPQADTYIDAWRPVDRVIISHGHACLFKINFINVIVGDNFDVILFVI